jgi:hypothetical protein
MRISGCDIHVLCSFKKRVSPIDGYYFQHRTKGPTVYITARTPDKWDRWRDDWVIIQIEVHDRLELPTTAPWVIGTARRGVLICSRPTTLCERGSCFWLRMT